MLAVALAAAATIIGFACGSATRRPSTLVPANLGPDNADGLLAVASRRPFLRAESGGASYGYLWGVGGDLYGGDLYGGYFYGGLYGEEWEEGYGYGYGYGAYGYGAIGMSGSTYGGMLYGAYRFRLGQVPASKPNPRPYANNYYAAAVVDGGTIAGRVTLAEAGAPRELAVAAAAGCGATIPNESVVTDASGNVANAVVYLENLTRGRRGLESSDGYGYNSRSSKLQVGGVLETRRCRFAPHIQLIAPIGATLHLSNSDRRGRKVRARRWGEASRDLVFTTALLDRGREYHIRLDHAGFIELRSTNSGEVGNAWVVVPRHPYYAITDRAGRFRLDDVPPGTYNLVVWHEPVITGVDAGGRPIVSAPISTRRKVTVKARRASTVNVKLAAR